MMEKNSLKTLFFVKPYDIAGSFKYLKYLIVVASNSKCEHDDTPIEILVTTPPPLKKLDEYKVLRVSGKIQVSGNY